MRFVADEMLGKLARWMRFMGLDVEYRRPFPDNELIELANRENRTILTRDRKIIEDHARSRQRSNDVPPLASQAVPQLTRQDVPPLASQAVAPQNIEVWAVEEDLPFDQMVTIIRRLNIDPFERAFTRCAACNHELVGRSREEVTGRVPPFVYSNVTEYRECPGCAKIYWAGSHRARIERILREAKEKAAGNLP